MSICGAKMDSSCRRKSIVWSTSETYPLLGSMLKYVFIMFFCVNFSSSQHFGQSNGSFVEECRMDCVAQRDPLTCGKYRAVRWLDEITKKKEFRYGPLRLVRLPFSSGEQILPQIPQSRKFKEYTNILNFVRNSVEESLTKRALVYSFDQPSSGRSFSLGPMLMDEEDVDRIRDGKVQRDARLFHKKKKSIVVPILVLVQLIKLKLLLLPIFFGVHFIKKFLVLGALFLPSILAHLKYCKIPNSAHHHQQATPYQSWSTAAEGAADYPTGFGHEDAGWSHRNDVQGPQGYGAGAQFAYPGPYSGYFQKYRQ